MGWLDIKKKSLVFKVFKEIIIYNYYIYIVMEIKKFCFDNQLSFIPVSYTGKIYDPPKGWKEMTLEQCNNYDDTNKMGFLIDTKNKFVILDADDQKSHKYITDKIEEYNLNSITTPSFSNIYKHVMYKKHFWFRVPENIKTSKKQYKNHEIYGDMDVITQTAEHKTKAIIEADDISVIPEVWLKELINERPKDVKTDDEKVDENKFSELLLLLKDERANNYESWMKIGMILKNENDGLLGVFVDFSKRGSNYKGFNDINKFWNGFKKDGSLKIGTLCLMAKEDDEKKFKKWQAKYKIENKDEYIKMKEAVEKELFFVKNMSCFGYTDPDEELLLKSRQDIGLIYSHLQYNDKSFIDQWLKDESRRSYQKIDFIPNNTNPLIYNTFKGFKYNNNNPINNDKLNVILNFIDEIFNNNKNDVNIMLDWIAWIRQRPERKTEKAVVMYSDTQGIGKNTLIHFINKILTYTTIINDIKDLCRNFNSQIANKLLICGDEVKSKAREIRDDLKNMITRTDFILEKKNQDQMKISDYSNYIFTSNNANAFYIEPTDRRFILFEMTNTPLSEEKSNELYKLLNDKEALESLDTFLKNRVIPEKLIAPMTDYKRKLIAQSLPAYIQMVYCDYKPFSQPRKWTLHELHEIAIHYAKSHYLESTFSREKMSKDFKKEFKEYYNRNATGRYYLFPDEIRLYNQLSVKRPELMFVDEDEDNIIQNIEEI